MNTPIYDFVNDYANLKPLRLHMPGHKGRPFLGCEARDITEIRGADALYEASGIIAQSEKNASFLFGSGRTLYGTEGSSQCIRAMVFLALTHRRPGAAPMILAGRNAHKSFLYGLALTGAEVEWLWPETGDSLLSCEITPAALERALADRTAPPCAVYVTSPDYLGGMADIGALAAVCRRYGVPLIVDNAHGAYLHFLETPMHPLDLGAAMCCDSAHKTLPVLTGGAYLHISADAPAGFAENAKAALSLFGSTSPSYLILQSLDLCNRYLAEGYRVRLAETVRQLDALRVGLRENGWTVRPGDPLRVTLRGDGHAMAGQLRSGGVEPEYADRDFCVLMAAPENTPEELTRIAEILGSCPKAFQEPPTLPRIVPEVVCSPREALFAPQETIPVRQAPGRICGAPTVSCPPAIPIAVSGERIGQPELDLFRYCGVTSVDVLK